MRGRAHFSCNFGGLILWIDCRLTSDDIDDDGDERNSPSAWLRIQNLLPRFKISTLFSISPEFCEFVIYFRYKIPHVHNLYGGAEQGRYLAYPECCVVLP